MIMLPGILSQKNTAGRNNDGGGHFSKSSSKCTWNLWEPNMYSWSTLRFRGW